MNTSSRTFESTSVDGGSSISAIFTRERHDLFGAHRRGAAASHALGNGLAPPGLGADQPSAPPVELEVHFRTRLDPQPLTDVERDRHLSLARHAHVIIVAMGITAWYYWMPGIITNGSRADLKRALRESRSASETRESNVPRPGDAVSGALPAFRAAVVQAAPVYFDLDATVEKSLELIAEAATNDARLIVFPETWIPGYPFWAWLDSPAWALQWVGRYFENSLELGGEHEQRIAAAAAKHQIHVVLGHSERAGGSLYMGQLMLDARGHRIAARRKLKPTHVERTVFGEGTGSDLAVHNTELGRLGALCCWEHLQPLSKFALFAQHEQIHAASWPSFSMYRQAHQLSAEFNDVVSQVYAVEGGCFVLAASATTSQDVVDLFCDTPAKRDLMWSGGGRSMIFGPDGSRLADYLAPDEEGLVYAELDLSALAYAKAITDPAGHSAHPDVTGPLLAVDEDAPVSDEATHDHVLLAADWAAVPSVRVAE